MYEAANQLEGTRLIAGKKVLNVLPHDFPSKGDAVRTLVARLGCDGAVVLGDDVTDEDAFAVGAPLVFGVHVGQGPVARAVAARGAGGRGPAARGSSMPRAERTGQPARPERAPEPER